MPYALQYEAVPRGRKAAFTALWHVPSPRRPGDQAFLRKLGQYVQAERLSHKITQEKLAEIIGVSSRTYQSIEAGEINVPSTTVARIQKALGCDWNRLLPRI